MKSTIPVLFLFLLFVISLALSIGAAGSAATWETISMIRAPRVFTAAIAGAAISAAGALSQSLFRNSLATPSIIGTEAGAAFSIALATLLLSGSHLTFRETVIYASIGAGIATLGALAILHLGRQTTVGPATMPKETLTKLLLGGFAMNAFLAAGTSLCLSLIMETGSGVNLHHWLMGSFSARTWEHVVGISIGYVLCLSAAWFLSPSIDVMSLGDDMASSLGVDVFRNYKVILTLISILVGSSISCGGALPFVGLVAPHIARIFAPPQIRIVLFTSSLIGAALTVLSDLVARTVRAPIDMDVGIITTMIGAPYFLWLMLRRTEP